MAAAWLGHLGLKELPMLLAILAAWLIVLPEYALNIFAFRLGHGPFTGGQMASFNLSSGVVCVALVSHYWLGETLGPRKLLGFGLMIIALLLISKRSPSKKRDSSPQVA